MPRCGYCGNEYETELTLQLHIANEIRENERWASERRRDRELAIYLAIEKEKFARQDQLLAREDAKDQARKKEGKIHHVEGESLRRHGKFSEAIGEIDQAIKLDSGNPNYYVSKAVALHGMGKFKEADAVLDAAIFLEPSVASLHRLKAYYLEDLDLLSDCLDETDKVIRLDPQSGADHSYKATILQKLGNNEGAIAEINYAIRLEPGNLEYIDAAIRLNSNNPAYHNKKGVALDKLRRYVDAIREHDEAIRLGLWDPMFHYDKGNTLYHLEKFEEATKEYELASNLDPKNLEYCNAKGNALKRSGRFPEALREIENGLAQAQGRSPRLLIAYAEVMACMDMTTAALNKLSSAIAPGGGIDWHDLAEVAKPELKSGTLSEKEKAMLNAFLELEPISSQTTSTETSGRIQRPRGITILVGIQIAGSLLASAVAEAVAADLHASVYPIVVPFVILPSIFALALFSGRSWARTLMLIGAVLDFESFFGIVWGVAFLWYLTRPRVTAYFKQPRS